MTNPSAPIAPRIKCFAINVAKNEYRRERILTQTSAIGFPVAIFNAVTPDTMLGGKDYYNDAKARRFTGRSLLAGEIACAQSHLALWAQLLDDDDADYYLILEDDIDVVHNMRDIVERVNLTPIDFLKLSGQIKRPKRPVRDLKDGFALVRYAYGPLDAAAYLLNKTAARKLTSYCKPVFTPIDIMMDRAYDHGVAMYGVMPYAAQTAFDFDTNSPLYTDVGVRDRKYDANITAVEKCAVKTHRIIGGVKRKIAALKLKTLSINGTDYAR